MKKILFIFLILISFFFFSLNVNAEVLDTLDCTYSPTRPSDIPKGCSMLAFSNAVYTSNGYEYTENSWLGVNNIDQAVTTTVEIGPNITFPAYVYGWNNYGLDQNYYHYNLVSGSIYSVNYGFYVQNNVVPRFYANGADFDFWGLNSDGDFVVDSVEWNILFNQLEGDLFPENVSFSPDDWNFYTVQFQFKPSNNYSGFRFNYGFSSLNEIFNINLDFLFSNSVSSYGSSFVFNNDYFSVTEISEFGENGFGNVEDSGGSNDSDLGNINDSLNDLNDNITNSDTSDSQDVIDGFFNDFQENDHGLSSIITAPLEFIRNLLGHSCQPLTFDLPFVEKDVSLPCIKPIYQQYFGLFFNLYQVITTGIIAYAVGIRIFGIVKGLQDPQNDKIEVLKL